MNAVANILTTAASDVRLSIGNEITNNIKSKYIGLFDKIDHKDGMTIEIGTLRFG